MMWIRVFTSKGCPECQELISFINKYEIRYQCIDAMSNDSTIETLCDMYSVDELPHIQTIEGEKVIKEGIGLDEASKIIISIIGSKNK